MCYSACWQRPMSLVLVLLFAPACGGRGGDPDLCDGVTCSFHGTCVVEDGAARCDCAPGYDEEGLACTETAADGDADTDADSDEDSEIAMDGDLDEDEAADGDAEEDSSSPTCGDAICSEEESAETCPEDCSCIEGVLDDFDDGDDLGWEVLRGAWSVDADDSGFVYRQTDAMNPPGTGTPHLAFLETQTLSDVVVTVDVTAETGGSGNEALGVVYRYVDEDNYYWVMFNPNFGASNPFSIDRLYHGIRTQIASAPTSNGASHRITVEVRGDRHILSKDGAPLIDITDPFIRSGHIGLATTRLVGRFDDIVLEDCLGCRQVFFDDFEDNDISDWVPGTLAAYTPARDALPVVEDGIYHADGTERYQGGHHRALTREIEGMAFEMRTRVRGSTAAGQVSFGVFADDERELDTDAGEELRIGHGYLCVWYPGVERRAQVLLHDGVEGAVLARATITPDEEWHILSCSRLADGRWEIRVDGELQELTTNVADERFTTLRYVSTFVDSDATQRALDDIEVLDCSE